MHQTLSIINKGHIFMNFDGMILTFYIWICVLQVWTQNMILSISTREPQMKLMLIWDSSILKY